MKGSLPNMTLVKYKLNFIYSIVLTIWVISSVSLASPSLSLQGRILKPDGTAFTSSNAQFKVQILSNDGNSCVLYEEVQSKDLSSSDGLFSVAINDGSGTRTDTNSWNFISSLSNKNAFNIAASSCPNGSATTYTPSTYDERQVVVSFRDGAGGTWEAMPATTLTHAAFAMDSGTVDGFQAGSLVRVEDSGVPGSVASMTSANYTQLMALINGTSSQYMKDSVGGGASLPVVAGSPATPAAGSIWFNSSTNTLQFYDGSAAQSVGTSGGSVTSVATGTGLTGGPITTSGTISLDTSGVTAGTYTKVTVDSYGRATSGATLVESDLPTISTAGKVSGSALTSGTIAGSTAINTSGNIQTSGDITSSRNFFYDHSGLGPGYVGMKAPADIAGAGGASYTLTLPANVGSTGQVLSAADASGNLVWSNVTSGTVTSVTAGTGLNVGAGPGGTITSNGTLNVNVGTGNNQIVQLNGSAKLPAVDGSQLTNLSTSQINAGVLPLTFGGTGAALNPVAKGEIIYSNSSSDLTSLAVGTTGQVLTSAGANAAPVWAAPAADGTKVLKSGDTMTGLLLLSADPTAALGAATKQYVDASTSGAAANYIRKDGSVAYTGDQSMGTNKLTNLADPVSAQDAATKNYADTTFLKLAGGTLAGSLNLPAGTNSSAPFYLASGSLLTTPASGAFEYDGTSLYYTDSSSTRRTLATNTGLANYVPLAGGTMSGLLVLSADPTSALGSATKQYVDSSVSTSSANYVPLAGGTMTGALVNNTNSASAAVAVTQSGSGNAATFMGGNVGIGTTSPSSTLDVNGAQTLEEIAAASKPAAAFGKDFIYADNSSHTLKVSLNGGSYVDLLTTASGGTNYVAKGGDTMTGPLVLSADPTAALGAATKQYVDNSVSTASGLFIKKDGSVAYTGDQSMGTHKLTNVVDPISAQDAATKNYADNFLIGKTLPTTPAAGQAGQSLRWNNGALAWEFFTPSTGSVTAVTAGTGLNVGAGPGGTISTTGTLNVNVGTGNNQIVQLDASSKLPAVNGSQLTNLDAGQIATGLLPLNRGGTGTALTPAGKGEIVYSNSTTALTSLAAGTSGYVLTSAGAGNAPTWAAVPADSTKVPLAGGTMTGLLLLSADPSAALGAATKQYVDNSVSTASGLFIKKDGSVAFTGAQSMGSNKLTNLTDPTSAQDAATKNYADTTFLKLAGGTLTGAITLPAGTTSAGGAPLYLTTGSLLTTKVGGAVEYDGTSLYYTDTGLTRRTIATTTGLASYLPLSGGTMTGALVNNTNSASTAVAVTQSGSGYAATFMGGNVGIGTTSPSSILDIKGAQTVEEIAAASAPTPAAGNDFIYADNSTHTLKLSVNGGAYSNIMTSANSTSGTVTSVTSANTDISVATTTTTPTLTLNSGTGANQILKLNASSKIPAVDGSLLTNLVASQITSGVFPFAQGGVGAVLAPAGKGEIVYSNSTTALTSLAAGTSGYVLTSAGAGNAPTWSAVPADSTKVPLAGGTMTGLLLLSADPSAALGAATKEYVDAVTSTSASSYLPLAGGTMTGALVNNTNSNSTAVKVTQSGSGYAATFTGGSVGIGTTSPGSALDVSGTIRTDTICDRTGANCKTVNAGWNSGTVNSGTINQLAYYGSAGTAVSGNANASILGGALTLGQSATTAGSLILNGSTSGAVSVVTQAAAGTYNFNLPITAGGSGTVLTSGGGAAAPMTWSTLATSATTDTTNAANITSGTLSASRLPAFTGDTTTSAGSSVTTTAKVNGVAYPTAPSSNTVPVVTSSNTITYEAVPAAAGGTGQSSYTVGDLLYASSTSALSKLNAGTANYVLTSGGPGVAPTWAAVSTTDSTKLPLAGGTMTGALVNNTNSASSAVAITQSGSGYAATFMGGNVGVGTTAPTYTLDITGNLRANNASGSLTFNPGTYPSIVGNNSGGTPVAQWITDGTVGGALFDYTGTPGGGTGYFAIRNKMNSSPNTVLQIDKDGKVGIGTTSPSSILDINGAQTIEEIATASKPTAAAGKDFIYADSTSHTLKVSLNGGSYVDLLTSATGSSGTVTSVTSANSDIAVASTTTAPVLTLNSGTGANQILKLNASSKIPAVDGSLLTNLVASQITSGVFPLAQGGVGAVLAPAGKGEIIYSNSTTALTSLAAGTSGYVLTSAGAGNAPTWSAVPADSTKVPLAGGTMTGLLLLSADPSAALGAATKEYVDAVTSTSASSYLPLAGGTMTGALVNNTNSASTAVAVTQSGSGYAATFTGGNVGIGTTSPTAPLHVVAADGTLLVRNTVAGNYAGMNMYDDTNTLTGSFQIGGSSAGVGAGSMFIGARQSSGKLMFVRGSGATEMARFDAAGNFVIGNTTASSILDINGAETVREIASASRPTAAAGIDFIYADSTSHTLKVSLNGGSYVDLLTTATGGSGTVNSGTANQLAYYGSTGTAVSGNANVTVSGGALTLGQSATTAGSLILNGSTSGAVSVVTQAAAGTYNFNLPITAGGSGTVLTSGGGAAAPMTWSTLATSATTDTTNAANISSGTLSASRLPAFTGDTTTSAGSSVTTTAKVNGVAYPTAPSSNTVPVVTSSNTITYEAVPAAAGGTGQSSYTIGDILYASSTSALSKLSAGTANYVLTSNGAGTAPSWTAVSTTDSTKLPLAGGTMTGALVNNTNSASTAVAVTQSGSGYAATFMGGNVGIGTTSPGQKLSVAGTIESTSGGIKFPDGTTQTTAAKIPNVTVTNTTVTGSTTLTMPTAGHSLQNLTISASATVSIPAGGYIGQFMTTTICQDSTGGYTTTFAGSGTTLRATYPPGFPTTTANACDVCGWVYYSTNNWMLTGCNLNE